MNFIQIITDLTDRGWSQQQIAEECDVTQCSISSIKRGNTRTPRYVLGAALIELANSGKMPPTTATAKANAKGITSVSAQP